MGALDIEWENNSDNASGNAAWSIDIFTYGFSVKSLEHICITEEPQMRKEE